MFNLILKQLRENQGLSQTDLGKILNVTQQTIGHYEKGKREPNQETLNKIADHFGVTTDYLLGRVNDPSPPKKQEPPDYNAIILSAPNLGEAIVVAKNLQVKYGLSKEWLHKAWPMAIEHFGVPKPVEDAEPAAHSNGVPGTGIFEDEKKKDKE